MLTIPITTRLCYIDFVGDGWCPIISQARYIWRAFLWVIDMKTYYLQEEVRTFISENKDIESQGSSIVRRVPNVEPVEAETWQDAKKKFKDLKLI